MTSNNTRREVLTALAATAVAAGITSAASTRAAANPQTGVPAPGFTATDSKGRQHTLAAYKGKTVVLEWTNHECPYTVKHYATGNMQALQGGDRAAGVVWLTVASSRPGEQGHVDACEADQLTADRNAKPTAVLLDPAGRSRPTLRRQHDAAHVRHRSAPARWSTWAPSTISPRPATPA